MNDDDFAQLFGRLDGQVQMHNEMMPYLYDMAQQLAAFGVASEQVTGDRASYAIDRWIEVLRTLAKEKLQEARQAREQPLCPQNASPRRLTPPNASGNGSTSRTRCSSAGLREGPQSGPPTP